MRWKIALVKIALVVVGVALLCWAQNLTSAGWSVMADGAMFTSGTKQPGAWVNSSGLTINPDGSVYVSSGSGSAPTMPFVWLPFVNQSTPNISPSNQTDGSANNLVCRSFNVPDQITATKFTATVALVSAGQTFNVGIYDGSGNLIRDSGAMSCASATQVSSTVSAFTLTPGNTYAQCVAITDTTCALSGVAAGPTLSSMENKNATRDFACANTLSAGALPATCGTPTAQASKSYLVLLEQ